MKIGHIADAHFGLGYPGPKDDSRFHDIVGCMNYAAEKFIEQEVDVVLYAGDFFKASRVYIDRASIEIKAATNWLRKLSSAGIEVVVISGTPSHDAISAYEIIAEHQIPNVSVYTKPAVHHCANVGMGVACLPGLNRSSIVTQDEFKGMQPQAIHQLMTEKIRQLTQGMLAQCNNDMVNVLMGHLTYTSADTGFDDLMMMNEPILNQEAVQGYDLVCLGHIHRPQQVGHVFYSGAPERHRFTDEHVDAGFWIHDTEKDERESTFIQTPAREFMTLDLDEWYIKKYLKQGHVQWMFINDPDAPWFPPVNNKIIRVRYTCSEELNKLIDRKAFEKSFYDAGAYFVAEIKADIERNDRVRDKDVNEMLSPEEAVVKWAKNQGIDEDTTTELQRLTANLMEEVSV